MGDLREQLRKAGLVSAKQVKQAKHQDRVHRKDVGREGLEEEKRRQEEEVRQEREEKRRQDQDLERARAEERRREEESTRLLRRIQAGWVREATGGGRRFFFEAGEGRITYLDLNDGAVRRLLSGGGAIVETRGAVRGEFCVVDGATATALRRDHADVVRYWSRPEERK